MKQLQGGGISHFLCQLKEQSKYSCSISRGHYRFENDTVYLRYGYSPRAGGLCVTLASIDVCESKRHQGRFSQNLMAIESFAKDNRLVVLIESVNNPWLPSVLLRKGYHRSTNDEFDNNYLKKQFCL